MPKLQTAMLYTVVSLSLGLTACGGGDKEASSKDAQAPKVVKAEEAKSAPVSAANIANGPDACFRAVTAHLGADAKVSEISSFFSAGTAIDSSDDEPQGQMTNCTVQYQSPDDPRKLVGTRMDTETGQFAPPSPIEITVMGNAADFRLEDHLIPLSNVNAAALTSVMDAQKARLSGVYSSYVWSGVRLMSPDAFNNKHTLRLDVSGRLAANDVKSDGYASVSTDGKAITADHLMP